MQRHLSALAAVLMALGLFTAWAADAQPAFAASPPLPERARGAINTPYVCVPSLIWRNPEMCPSYGPGTTAYRVATIRLPNPLPQLPVLEFPDQENEDDVLPHKYGHVKTTPLNIYRHPMEAAAGLPPVRVMLSGDWWLSLDSLVEYEGQQWYQINENEYVPADAVALAWPSRFQGVYLTEQPAYPFAWINQPVQPSLLPQGELNGAVALNRYQLVTIFAEERRGDELWYLVGQDQWVEQYFVSRADVDPRPAAVGPSDRWIEVDLFEQTVAAYEGDRMVYATLISGGRTATATPPGLYQLWFKIREGKMSNPDVDDGNPGYYYIEDVPWTMYFHEGYSIHTAFWHDSFGFQRSHGCINLSPRDALWFFNWADPILPEDVDELYIGGGMPNTWVWTHFEALFEQSAPAASSAPRGETESQ